MTTLLDSLARLPDDAGQPAIVGDDTSLARSELIARSGRLAELLRDSRCVAVLADNGPAWIVADLACQHAGVAFVPVPGFFTPAQIRHCLATCGADCVLTDDPAAFDAVLAGTDPGASTRAEPCGHTHAWQPEPASGLYRRSLHPRSCPQLPDGTTKITFTSGSTGEPKGVCLDTAVQLDVARAIVDTVALATPRHLCILPLATLLENVAGVYAPLLAGGSVRVPSLASVGLGGSASIDLLRMVGTLGTEHPQTIIVVPQLLVGLVAATGFGWTPPASLAFVAVGGGRVAPDLVIRARTAGLPVWEGYGLSECASVVTLNGPGRDRIGSAGRSLPNVRVSVVDDELVVHGRAFLGYVGEPESWYPSQVHTGDVGWVDDDGFVHVTGRRKNIQITSFGRNLNPEWVESELLASPVLQQAVVFAEARPAAHALLVARDASVSYADVSAWIETVNQRLPDYARITAWRRLDRPMSSAAGLYTPNGRPRRDAIECAFANELAELGGPS